MVLEESFRGKEMDRSSRYEKKKGWINKCEWHFVMAVPLGQMVGGKTTALGKIYTVRHEV